MAKNPGQNNNQEEGPPDLDELLNDLRKKIGRMFGKKEIDQKIPKSSGANPTPNAGNDQLPIVPIVLIVVLLWAATGFYIVDQGSRGVVLRFGKNTEVTMPGPRWHIPYPIESAEVVNLEQVRTIEVGYRSAGDAAGRAKELRESLMLTDDENIIDLQFAVQYNLKSAEDFLFNNRSADASVRGAAESAIREIVGKSKMDFALYEGREEIAVKAKKLMQEILDRYNTGINVTSVTMQNAQPPEQVQEAFEDVNRANQDNQRQINEGQAYANDVIPRARGNAARLIEEANGYRERVVAQSEGDSARFKAILTEYEKAPKVTKDRLYIDAMQEIYTNVTKVIVDSKGNSQLLYLPLDKLIEKTAPPSSDGTSAASAAAAARAAETSPSAPRAGTNGIDTSVRDAMRNRDRGVR